MDASQKLGQKLLQGWTMLGDSCNTCSSPLMRSRDGNQIICVVCEPKQQPVQTTVPSSVRTETSSSTIPAYLIELLDTSLLVDPHAQSIETFCDLLESALETLRTLKSLKCPLDQAQLAKIRIKISQKLAGRASNTCHSDSVIKYFKSINRLLILSHEYENLN